jgi:hypothetical protein
MTTIKSERISHQVALEFEPLAFVGGYSKGDKKAHALNLSWTWADEWTMTHPTVHYRRIKKDGTFFQDAQSAMLWADEAAPFMEMIEATRPQYVPVSLRGNLPTDRSES